MACAANFAFVNRTTMTFLVRQAFSKIFNTTPDDLDMHLIYDVRWVISSSAKDTILSGF